MSRSTRGSPLLGSPAVMSSPRSGRSSFSSSPYTSHPRLSIRAPRSGVPSPTILDHLIAPFKRGKSRRLLVSLLAGIALVSVLIWRSSEGASEERACILLPWLKRCIGSGSHPLDLLHFEKVSERARRGRLCSVAHLLRSAPTVGRIPLLPGSYGPHSCGGHCRPRRRQHAHRRRRGARSTTTTASHTPAHAASKGGMGEKAC